MKVIVPVAIVLLWAGYSCTAQDITVHVIEKSSQKPVEGVYLNLRLDCQNPHRPKAQQQKTDGSGTPVFRSVSFARAPACMDLFSVEYASLDLDYIFGLPGQIQGMNETGKLLNPVITAFPADVTYHVRKRSFAERLHFLFAGE
jgi:hypothetical protein